MPFPSLGSVCFHILTCSLKAELEFAEEDASRIDPMALTHGVLWHHGVQKCISNNKHVKHLYVPQKDY